MSFRGIDVRETGDRLIYRVLLQDSDGALVTTGTTTLKLYELQNDGTLLSYDFDDNTFKSGALTTETQTLTHRQGNNSTTNTGLWTWAQTTLTGFTPGSIYFAMSNNSGATPTDQIREFQFGGSGDDMVQLGTVNDANTAPSTTVFAAEDITEATADHYIGRVALFVSGVLKYQAAPITDYVLDTGEGKFTVKAMTEAPSDGDKFIIV